MLVSVYESRDVDWSEIFSIIELQLGPLSHFSAYLLVYLFFD